MAKSTRIRHKLTLLCAANQSKTLRSMFFVVKGLYYRKHWELLSPFSAFRSFRNKQKYVMVPLTKSDLVVSRSVFLSKGRKYGICESLDEIAVQTDIKSNAHDPFARSATKTFLNLKSAYSLLVFNILKVSFLMHPLQFIFMSHNFIISDHYFV